MEVAREGTGPEVEGSSPPKSSPVVATDVSYENPGTSAVEDDKTKVSFHQSVEITKILIDEAPIAVAPGENEPTAEPLKGPRDAVAPALPQLEEDTPTMGQLYETEGTKMSYKERTFTEPKVVRRMNRVDIETGRTCWKQQTASPVWDFKEPMNPVERKKGIMQGLAQNKTDFDEVDDKEEETAQFRLRSKVEDVSHSLFSKDLCLVVI